MARIPLAASAAAALALAAPAAALAHGGNHNQSHDQGPIPIGQCMPGGGLLGFTDAPNKTTFHGTDVGGLSGLVLNDSDGGRGRWTPNARALVDNEGAAPARTYDLRVDTPRRSRGAADGLSAKVVGMTTLRRPDGTPYTGLDFDGEALQ